MELYRQGDILFVKVEEAPEGKTVKRQGGRIIVAEGEATGHHHAVADVQVNMIEATDATRYLVAKRVFAVTHEEHAVVNMPAGVYLIVNQREYTPEAVRRVID